MVIKNYQQLLGLTKQLSWALTPSMVEFSWAWFTVNTRAVYLNSDPRWPQRCSTHSPSPTDDNLGEELEKRCRLKMFIFAALVPYLDLLNHTSEVEVTAGIYPDPLKTDFDVRNSGYRIVTHTPVKKHQQVRMQRQKRLSVITSYQFVVLIQYSFRPSSIMALMITPS